jgi:hypothetical protein
LLLPGVLLLFCFRCPQRLRGLGAAPLIVVLVLLTPWLLYSRDASKAAEKPAEQLRLFDYQTAVFHVDAGDPDSPRLSIEQWGRRIQKNAALLASSITECMLGSQAGWAQALVLLLIAIGLTQALARGPTLLEWFFLSQVGLLLIYFTFADRLIVPLLPPLYAYLVGGLCWVAQRLTPFPRSERKSERGLLVATVPLTVLMALNLSALPERLDPQGAQLSVGSSRDVWDDYARAGQWLRDNTAPDAAIMTEMAPIIGYHSQRRVYTNRFSRGPALLQRYDIDYVVVFAQSRDSLKESATAFSQQEWVLPGHVAGRYIRIHRIDKQAVKKFLDGQEGATRGSRVREAAPARRR